MKERHHENPVDKVKAVISAEELIEISNEAMNTYISDLLYQYIAEIADATRNDKDIVLGLSPRGALALCRAVKANAYIEGREYAVTEDVLAVVNDVAVHRLVISSKARLHEKTTEDILNDILSRIRKPDLKDLRNFK